ncbi:uncharacterized protein LOC132304887 [Cornus florida]|uniref:uncharacterized protein LOC132304887 n=1 Tax=Cornus florida TaxID=4283 RepID=UPI00289F618E|nr:uncharacterized protein LOC132304887 [Cornus florida]
MQKEVKQWIIDQKFALAILEETRVKEGKAQRIQSKIRNNRKWLANYRSSYLGKIWVGWNGTVFDVKLLKEDAQSMLLQVKHIQSGIIVCITVIYATNKVGERRELWKSLKEQTLTVKDPWIALGDWNIVRYNYEKKGGLRIPQARLDEFNSLIYDLQMDDIPINNGDWSWCNKQNCQARINAKLDRVLTNVLWPQKFNDTKVYLTAASLFDHYGIVVKWHLNCSEGPKPFKFLKIWCLQQEMVNVVTTAWEVIGSGNPIHILQQKLRAVKAAVKEWNKVRGFVSDQIQEVRDHLHQIQMELLQDPTLQDNINKEREASGKLQQTLELEEIMWAKNPG